MFRKFVDRSKKLRSTQTESENELWYFLRGKRFNNLKFYRQYVIAPYIVDFCCPNKKLIIELDGSGHLEPSQEVYDKKRDLYLKSLGYIIIRVFNSEWQENKDGILEHLNQMTVSNSPSP